MFCEQGLGGFFHYTPFMRGLIRHDPAEPTVAVIGLVNWFAVALVAVLAVELRRNIVYVAPYVVAGFAILYFIQAVRYWRVGTQLSAGAHHDPQRPQP